MSNFPRTKRCTEVESRQHMFSAAEKGMQRKEAKKGDEQYNSYKMVASAAGS